MSKFSFKKALALVLSSIGIFPTNTADALHQAKLDRVNTHNYPTPKKRGKFKPYSRMCSK